MAAVEKFLFHTDFDEPPVPVAALDEEEDLPPPPTFSEEELEAARQEALAIGQTQGRDHALHGIEQSSLLVLQTLSSQIAEIGEQIEEHRRQAEIGGLKGALAIIRKMFPALARREELAEIEAVIIECLQRLSREPRVVVRMSAEMLDCLQPRIDAIATDTGFEGRLVLLSGDEFGPSDVKVEWADGGAERDTEGLWQEIETLLHHVTAAPETESQVPSDGTAMNMAGAETGSAAPAGVDQEGNAL